MLLNNSRRNVLRKALDLISEAISMISSVRDDEQFALDNMPENLQSSYRYEQMEEGLDGLDDAIEALDEVASKLEEVVS